MIKIVKLSEPKDLKKFREDSKRIGGIQGYDELFTNIKDKLRLQLLDETQWRCAYCMKPLTLRNTIIEHIVPRATLTKMDSTIYSNLVINCDTKNAYAKYQSCSAHKKDIHLLKVDHLLFDCIEEIITYSFTGEILSTDRDIETDLKTLNLNNPNLIENRYKVILQTIKLIRNKKEDHNYTMSMKRKYEDKVRSTSFPYPGVVIDLFKKT